MAMNIEEKEIGRVVFQPTSNVEIASSISKVIVDVASPTVIFKNNNTLHDLRFGAFLNMPCGTCKKSSRDCPGHFGHCVLVRPVVNPMFIKPLLTMILKTFCGKCGKADCKEKHFYYKLSKVRKQHPLMSSVRSAKKRRKLSEDHQGQEEEGEKLMDNILANAMKRAGLKFYFKRTMPDENGNEIIVSSFEVYQFIASIPKETYMPVLNNKVFESYRDLADAVFIENLPILPITVRFPNVSKGTWYPSHITSLYSTILKKNAQLRNAIERKLHSGLIEEYHHELQDAVNILFDIKNTTQSLRVKTSDAGGLRQMIDRKKGIVRGNLMGKRVEFSARSVLSGDPKLGLNEVGLPISICKNLTVPRVVNVYNKHMLTKWSIRYVTKRSNGKRFDASLLSNVAEFVEVGDTIERSLENGDIVAVNRQPSLHRGSMTAMRVRMFPCDTIRLNYSSLPSFNGDCDGDEFNIHVPQSDEARAELEELMMMSSSIVCSQSSKPLLGLTQDSLLGAHLMSNHPLEEVDFGSILYQAGVEVAYEEFIIPVLLKPKRLYVGFQLINCVLRDLEIDLGEHYNHAGVLIRNGEIIEATFTKATLGIADNSLIHRVFLMYGHNKAYLFLERVQRVAEHFMDYHGFSVGISDCVVEHTPLNIDGVDRVIREDLEMRGRMPDEDKLCAALNSITQIAAPESCIGNNRILDMINAGSKGSMVNFNQITRMLSQQFSAQGRLLPEMSNETRYLPHLTKFDYSLEARGFIKNSFIKGLTPIEFWSHAKPSRINLIDTSCKTSVTGDQQRRLVKTLERIVVNDAGSGSRIVQNMTNGQVVSFQYGEDGLDGTYMRTFDEL